MRYVIPNTDFLKMMLVGRSGSTKTRTAYSACLDERMGRVLGLDMMGQPRSIRNYRPAPDIIGIDALSELSRVYRWLVTGQLPNDPFVKEMKALGLELQPPYGTLVIDGWSEAQRHVVALASGNTAKGPGDKPAQVEIQHYNTILAQTLAMAEMFYRLPMHVISTCLEQEREDNIRGTVSRLQLVGQAREQLSSYPEIVGRLQHVEKLTTTLKSALKNELTEETVSVCFFKPSPRYEAKDQTGALGDYMVDPSITKILDLIEASK